VLYEYGKRTGYPSKHVRRKTASVDSRNQQLRRKRRQEQSYSFQLFRKIPLLDA